MHKIIIASLAILCVACTGSQSSSEGSGGASATSVPAYKFEPAVSRLVGQLTSTVYWGPPGYGEDTISDEKEQVYVLVLDKGIGIQQPEIDLSNGYNAAISNITRIQLLNQGSLNKYLNKSVQVTGTLFGAQTGHHHTDVLLDLKTIRKN